jgi:hypothetical protein
MISKTSDMSYMTKRITSSTFYAIERKE